MLYVPDGSRFKLETSTRERACLRRTGGHPVGPEELLETENPTTVAKSRFEYCLRQSFSCHPDPYNVVVW